MINIWCMLHEMKYICKIGQKKVSVIFRFWYNSSQMSNFKLQNFFEKSKPEIRKKGKMSDKKILLEIYPNIFFYFEIERRLFRLFLSDTNQVKDWQRKIFFQIQQINSSDKKKVSLKKILLFPQIKIPWRVWPNIAHNCNKIAANSISHFRNFLAEFFSDLNFIKERFFFILIL